jgi:probable HAF family extracellular repeat protein
VVLALAACAEPAPLTAPSTDARPVPRTSLATYTLVDLSSPGDLLSVADDINHAGWIVGSYVETATPAVVRALVRRPDGTRVTLTELPGGSGTSGASINAAGDVAGFAFTAGGPAHAAVWWGAGGPPQDLGTLGGPVSDADGINDWGEVVGTSQVPGGARHAFYWSAGTGMVDITPGAGMAAATGINNLGQVVGSFGPDHVSQHAFVWSAGQGLTDLGTLGGPVAQAVAINDGGEVVGVSFVAGSNALHGFRWTATTGMVDLGPSEELDIYVWDVSNRGEIVGTTLPGFSANYRGFSYQRSGRLIRLPGIAGGFTTAYGVNDCGQVVGVTTTEAGGDHATLWNRACARGGLRPWSPVAGP